MKAHSSSGSFNSLQTGKSFRTQCGKQRINGTTLSFHSLPTGKSFRTCEGCDNIILEVRKFPFPSNGKVLSDRRKRWNGNDCSYRVSIPFQRESPFGLYTERFMRAKCIVFQFPSNGKVYSKCQLSRNAANWETLFQFPSNGKVYSKPVGGITS